MRRHLTSALSSPSSSSFLALLSSFLPLSSAPSPALSSPHSVTLPELTSLLHLHCSSFLSSLSLHKSGRRLLWLPSSSPLPSVPTVAASSLTPHQFVTDYVSTNQPVIINGAVDQWFGVGDWSVERLREMIGDCEMKNVFRSLDGRFKFFKASSRLDDEGLRREERMTFDEFVSRSTSSTDRYYLYGEPLPVPLQSVLTPPSLLSDCPSLTSSLLWVSTTGSFSPLHYDLSNGVLIQLHSIKQFLLFSPSDYTALSPHPLNHPHDRQSTLTLPTSPSLTSLPPSTHPYTAQLKPGELLFIPYGWWHQVESRGPSVSVTYRWNEWTNDLKRIKAVADSLQHLPPTITSTILSDALSSLPPYVRVWVMRRSVLAGEFAKRGLI